MKPPKWTEYGGRFWITGVQYHDIKKVRGKLSLGKQVRFIGNPSNPYDKYAIRVMYEGTQIGWVPFRRRPLTPSFFKLAKTG